jgi:hypothetical protein
LAEAVTGAEGALQVAGADHPNVEAALPAVDIPVAAEGDLQIADHQKVGLTVGLAEEAGHRQTVEADLPAKALLAEATTHLKENRQKAKAGLRGIRPNR